MKKNVRRPHLNFLGFQRWQPLFLKLASQCFSTCSTLCQNNKDKTASNNSEQLLALDNGDLQTSLILHPYYITGISDAESSFHVALDKRSDMKRGWKYEEVIRSVWLQKIKCC